MKINKLLLHYQNKYEENMCNDSLKDLNLIDKFMLLIIPDMCFSFLHKNKNKNVKFVITQQPEFKFIHFLLKIFRNDPLKT